MASRKKRPSLINSSKKKKSKRKISAQTRMKLKQAADRRVRSKGRFVAGGGKRKKFAASEHSPREAYHIRRQEAEQRFAKEAPGASDKLKSDFARTQTQLFDLGQNPVAEPGTVSRYPTRSLTREDTDMAPIRVSSTDVRESLMRRREHSWNKERGLYATPSATRGSNRQYIPVSTFMNNELSQSHRREIESMMDDPNSPFNKGLPLQKEGRTKYSSGARNRLTIYTRKLQEGASHEEALDALSGERRGRRPASARTFSPEGETVRPLVKKEAGRRTKFESSTPRPSDFSFGIDSVRPDTIDELRKRMPGKSERQLVEISQRQKEFLYNEEILKNQRWAHETRTANILGKRARVEGQKESFSPTRGPDSVTIFTTNLGYPNVTVPTDSLIGQYVIRKRKRNLLDSKVASRSQLKGRFPEAVRDQHVIEAVTARHLGAEGRVGVYKRGGWRFGNKRSTGFGKSTPVGSQIIYDNAGRPMFDENGNIRFSHGATRPFKIGTEHEKGLGVYIG